MQAYACIWEFDIEPAAEAEFLRHYRPGGTWAALFAQDPAYVETVLLKDAAQPARYLTIDRWRSEADYRRFRERHAAEYARIDAMCEALTRSEKNLGSYFDMAAAGPA